MNFDALRAPLDKSAVSTRKQAGMTLSYIESWHAIAEANRIFGHDGWHSETVMLEKVREEQVDGKWRVGYIAKVRVTVEHDGPCPSREGIGYGSGIARDLGDAIESAVKEAESDARKRALMTFGNPFGLALYDKAQRNVVDTNGHEPQEQSGPPVTIPDQPGSWWEKDSLHLPVPKDANGELMWRKWVEDKAGFLARVSKAPSPGLLDKVCKDNIETITHIRENCAQGLWRDVDSAVKARHSELVRKEAA